MTALATHLAAFLREHLPHERKASPHTCATYAYSFQLLVCFAARQLKVKPIFYSSRGSTWHKSLILLGVG